MTAQRPAGPGSPPRRGALLQNVLAKALYDNVAESPDELSFRKGDIMTVLERNTQGLDGWWLCSLHGRQGIVPGNRLKILVGMYDKKQQQAPGPAQGQAVPQPPVPQPALPYHHQGGYTPLSPASQYTPMHPAYAPQGDNVYLMPVPSKGQQGLYPGTVPTGQFSPAPAKQPPAYPKQTPPHAFPSPGQEIYQVPPSLGQAAEAYPGGSANPPQDVYQVPPSAGQAQDIYQVPPSLDTRSWEGHKPQGKVLVPTRVGQAYVYDSPKGEQDEYDFPRHLLSAGSQEIYDVPPVRGGVPSQFSQEVYDTPPMAVKGPNGQDPGQEIYDVPPSVEKNLHQTGVRTALRDLLEFARGAVGNAAQASDRSLSAKLSKQLQKMEEVYQALARHGQALDACHWAPSALAGGKPGTDDLEHFVMHSRGVPDDTKQLASFLHGNASLLFKRTKPAAESGGRRPSENSESGWMEDYDYVHLQGKEEFEKTQKELLEKGNIIRQSKEQLQHQQLKQFERLEQEVTRPIDNDLSNWSPPQHYGPARGGGALCPADRQLLLFYLEQCEANLTTLTNAVDAFLTAVSTNQPPKIFVAHSKFVILSAHKLVFIGDTLSRQAKAQDVQHKVMHYSNLLCEMLKEIVVTTKAAALHYPSPTASKDMVERVKDLANSTQQFRMVLGQLAAM
ncbi:PREDICTED: breast cancer anti-estrogen resistance protein 1 [Charadrius vociferus]|uniref:breast cancer anti-estrogen resistance protein 1 n=1 Tax=Charadrius vociferus TaxID=50402 RepID=UPI0005219405|nr:PREDICTED: breast cancer anti-estrogen resistance protein 1 [Charadrius vociferus]